MATENKNAVAATENAVTTAPQETKKLRRPFIFQGQEYDLNTLTETQKEYLKGFPDEVPFLK